MRRKLILILSLFVLLIPFNIKAEEDIYTYKSINISAVFITQADVSGITKIVVKYTTFYNGKSSPSEVVLLRDNNFSTTISVGTINDANFNYAYCVTYDDKKDIYGFLPITAQRTFDDENGVIRLTLSVDFNAMNYDGARYRKNSDVSNDELEQRKNGSPSYITKVDEITTVPTTQVTTTTKTPTDDDGNIIIGTTTSTTTVIKDNKADENEKNVNNKKEKSTLGLIYLVLGIFGVGLLIFVVYTLVKMYQANKRV